jgi:hypothetical protein
MPTASAESGWDNLQQAIADTRPSEELRESVLEGLTRSPARAIEEPAGEMSGSVIDAIAEGNMRSLGAFASYLFRDLDLGRTVVDHSMFAPMILPDLSSDASKAPEAATPFVPPPSYEDRLTRSARKITTS